MRIVIAGGHGKIAMHLERLLARGGHQPVGLIRNPAQASDLRDAGAEAEVCDLEKAGVADLAAKLTGADAVVFAAGAGPGSGEARKVTVDRDAAILLADAAERAKVGRYVMISAMGVDEEPPEDTEPVFAAYLRAKGEADAYLRSRDDLAWTVLRPGMLTNSPGTGRVTLAADTGRGQVPREDVAAVVVAMLTEPTTAGLSLDLISGETVVSKAVAGVARPS